MVPASNVAIRMFQHTAARRRLRPACLPTAGPVGFQHTAARRRLQRAVAAATLAQLVSTHSRPKAAAAMSHLDRPAVVVSTHSRPKAAACRRQARHGNTFQFQHTAARRRLRGAPWLRTQGGRFNTQPPEGGCRCSCSFVAPALTFQHTAARRRLRLLPPVNIAGGLFQHTAARRRLR